jgi:hypothetical protein
MMKLITWTVLLHHFNEDGDPWEEEIVLTMILYEFLDSDDYILDYVY